MYRLLLIITAATVFALPGVYSVATNAATTPPPPSAAGSPEVLYGAQAIAAVSTAVAVASPSSSDAPVTVASGADDLWHRTAVTVDLVATDGSSGIAYTTYQIDDGAWARGTTVEIAAPKDHANDGVHTINFYSVDNVGRIETTKSVTVKIDTTPPAFKWSGVSPSVIYKVAPVRFSFYVRDLSGEVTVSWRATDQYGYFAASQGGLKRETGDRSVPVVPRYKNHEAFTPGLYDVMLTLKDLAGNVCVTSPRSFRDYCAVHAKVFFHLPAAGRRVALTFDDGGAGPWESMLNTLKAYHAHATFFPLGPYAEASPSLMRRTVKEGNALGSHGWTHTDMTHQSYAEVRSELIRSEAPWWNGADTTPVPYCRPPYGSYNSTTVAAAGSAGFARIIIWDVDPRDWTEPGSSVIAERVLSHVHPGAIVCMHLRPQTAAALPAILSGLHARGYEAVSLPELFHAAGYR